MTNSLPPKEHMIAVYEEYLVLAKELMAKCKEMDAHGAGRFRKTAAVMLSPQGREIINRTADDCAEMKVRGIKKIPSAYFKNDAGEMDPAMAQATVEMKNALSFFNQQLGVGMAVFALGVKSGMALRRAGIKPIHSKLFAAPVLHP